MLNKMFHALSDCLALEPQYNECKLYEIFLCYYLDHSEEIVNVYNLLNDIESKNLLVKLFRYYLACAMTGTDTHYQIIPEEKWKNLVGLAKKIKHVKNDYIGERIELFLLDGYFYKDIIYPNEGDVVFDCGAYTGNSSIYFSEKVGLDGKVFCFEPMKDAFGKLSKNLRFSNNVEIFNKAIWNETTNLEFTDTTDPGSHIIHDDNNFLNAKPIEVEAISIDDFVKENNLDTVNFIKMDIEGAEKQGLEGAKETIVKFTPDLAICVYHNPEDIVELSNLILKITVCLH